MEFGTRYTSRKPTTGITFTEESMTLQSEYPSTTIDYYLKKYSQTGLLGDPLRAEAAQFLDVTGIGDFADMQNKIRAVTEQFEQLPAEERRKYGDDVRIWVEAQMQAAVESGGADAGLADEGGSPAPAESDSVKVETEAPSP